MDTFLREVLTGMGIELVGSDEFCDASMTVDVIGKALGDSYLPGGYLFTGADIEGEIVFSAPGKPEKVLELQILDPPSKSVVWSENNPPDEPSDVKFINRWEQPVSDYLEEIWGPKVYIYILNEVNFTSEFLARFEREKTDPEVVNELMYALGSDDPEIGSSAARIIAEFVEAGRFTEDDNIFIPGLIDMLSRYEGYRKYWPAKALRLISGEEALGEDPQAWSDWWRDYQGSITPAGTLGTVFQLIGMLGMLLSFYGLMMLIFGKFVPFKTKLEKRYVRLSGLLLVCPTILLLIGSITLNRQFDDSLLAGAYLVFVLAAAVYLVYRKREGRENDEEN
jgi:hypothetical protein